MPAPALDFVTPTVRLEASCASRGNVVSFRASLSCEGAFPILSVAVEEPVRKRTAPYPVEEVEQPPTKKPPATAYNAENPEARIQAQSSSSSEVNFKQ